MSYSWFPSQASATEPQSHRATETKTERLMEAPSTSLFTSVSLYLSGRFDLTQKAVLQPAVHRDDVAGSFRQPGRDEQEDDFGLVFRLYRRLRQCSFRVEVRQLFTQGFG